MISDEDPLRRRPRKSTVKPKPRERCVWMTTNLAERASEHGQIIKIWLSDVSGGNPIPTAAQNWYGRIGF